MQMELLAPAGTIPAFAAAVHAGADAVYVGAPTLNARALAKNFTYPELGALADFARAKGVKTYVAMNSLLKEEEIPQAIEVLAVLDGIGVDGLILQDLGIYALAHRLFPRLRLHASTLMTATNALALKQFAAMGFKRVVLSRELTLEEIGAMAKAVPGVELEVFIHGALCFSYSGQCFFSSYLGGKSGLRGRCVQPCRRRYVYDKRGKGLDSGYFFSMNDLCGIDLLPKLAAAGVTSLKIEGRMRSVQYVQAVVRAYRLAIDGGEAALPEARGLLETAMGRRETKGYFLGPRSAEIISATHSGNIGNFLGKIEASGPGGMAKLVLKCQVRKGDRLRLHQEKSGERLAFSLKKIERDNRLVDAAAKGNSVFIEVPGKYLPGDSLYLVDVLERKETRTAANAEIRPDRFKQDIARLTDKRRLAALLKQVPGQAGSPGRGKGGAGRSLRFRLQIDDLRALDRPLPFKPEGLVVVLGKQTLAQAKRMKKTLHPYKKILIWALPPVIEQSRLAFFEEAVALLRRLGYQRWELGHLSQLQLFASQSGVELGGASSLNILNSVALGMLAELGLRESRLSVEIDRQNLALLLNRQAQLTAGLTVYGLVPLFTARLDAEWFRNGSSFISPKKESFVIRRVEEQTMVLPDKPFSLLPWAVDLAAMGLDYGVVDLSFQNPDRRALEDLRQRVKGGQKRVERLSAFNFQGGLQ